MPKNQWDFFHNVTPLFKTLHTGLSMHLVKALARFQLLTCEAGVRDLALS